METPGMSREATDLDEAFYVASCLARSARDRTVVIWTRTIMGDEEYMVLDDGDRPDRSEGEAWFPCYSVTSMTP